MATKDLMQRYQEVIEKYQTSIINPYYANGAKKIRKIADKVLKDLSFFDVDKDDYYSLVDGIFLDLLGDYDGKSNFESFLYFCLKRKFITFMRDSNRDKRKNKIKSINEEGKIVKTVVSDVSLDVSTNEDDDIPLKEVIEGFCSVEDYFFENNPITYTEKISTYLNRISFLSVKVLKQMVLGKSPNEIISELNITKKQYSNCIENIKAARNTKLLI